MVTITGLHLYFQIKEHREKIEKETNGEDLLCGYIDQQTQSDLSIRGGIQIEHPGSVNS